MEATTDVTSVTRIHFVLCLKYVNINHFMSEIVHLIQMKKHFAGNFN